MASLAIEVPGLFPPPTREDTVKAVALALLRVRASGVTSTRLAKLLECSDDTILHASNERGSLLSFDSVARLMYYFRGEETAPLRALWNCGPSDEPTPAERIERAIHDLELVKKGLGA